jgi:G3E family GTPase
MMKPRVIIIGGFLGAGKTTLLWELASRLKPEKSRVGFITNDQAQGLVDTALLSRTGRITTEVFGSCFCCNFPGFLAAIDSLREKDVDTIIAEPVGSCTDLTATVMQPLKEKKSAEIELLPFSVLADAGRLEDILAGNTGGLHKSAVYILKKQLEEADYILVNKADLLSEAALDSLLEKVRAAFPQARVYGISALKGTGIASWLEEFLADRNCGRHIRPVDYDIYAEGEAVLGWLNTELVLTTQAPLNWRSFLEEFLSELSRAIDGMQAPVGHIKAIIKSGGDYVIGNITGLRDTLSVRGGEPASSSVELILNARVEMEPRTLEDLVVRILERVCAGKTGYTVTTLHCLSPGRPNPTYRYTRTLD